MSHPAWYPHAIVGATLYDSFKNASAFQEQLAVDLDIPIAKQWVELKRKIVEIADDLGIGAEVGAMFDVLKAGAVVSYVAPAGTAGAAAALGVTAGVAAGVVGGLVIAVFAIFSDDDDEEAAAAAAKAKLRANLLHLLERPSFTTLAADQDKDAARLEAALSLPLIPATVRPMLQQRAGVARKLSSFYQLAAVTLSSSEGALFLDAAHVARLRALSDLIAGGFGSALKQGNWKQANTLVKIQIAVPDLPQRLSQAIAAATNAYKTRAAQPTTPRRSGPGFFGLLFISAGAFVVLKPTMALGLFKQAGSAASSVAGKVVSKVKGG